jgi:hypothetical protein
MRVAVLATLLVVSYVWGRTSATARVAPLPRARGRALQRRSPWQARQPSEPCLRQSN